MEDMSTVSEVLNILKERGYTIDFNLHDNCLICHNNSLQVFPDEFVVDKHYRFEGLTDPGDEAVVYAISSRKHNIKGTLVNGYGIYSDNMADEMIKALNKKENTTDENSDLGIDEKSNNATPQRPEGDRPLDGPLVEIDLAEFKRQIREEETWKLKDRNAITVFKTHGMNIVLIAMHEGAVMKTHTAPGIISVQVLEGQIAFKTSAQTSELGAGGMLALHAGIPHSVIAVKESVFLLTLANAL